MTLVDAIVERVSCRAYTDEPLADELIGRLRSFLKELSCQEVRFELVGPTEEGGHLQLARPMFSGQPRYYVTCVAPEGALYEERVGYLGEQFVLFATTLGLGTCWVHGTYKKESAQASLGLAPVAEGAPAEPLVLHDVIPVGWPKLPVPLAQRSIRAGIRRKDKPLSALCSPALAALPKDSWQHRAIHAVQLGPSAINEQPVYFSLNHEDELVAELPQIKSGIEWCDLGIAKYHVEVIAREEGLSGTWEEGAPARFCLTNAR